MDLTAGMELTREIGHTYSSDEIDLGMGDLGRQWEYRVYATKGDVTELIGTTDASHLCHDIAEEHAKAIYGDDIIKPPVSQAAARRRSTSDYDC